MTTNGYTIQPQTLRTAASGLTDAGDRLSQEWSSLLSTVQGMGAPWGGDDIGMLIGTSYTAIQEQANESFTGAAEDMTAFAEKLTAVADNYEKAEQQMVGEVTSVSAALNG
ncbi:WXG100 family type VII secretion target [Actinomadura rudentiformis]|uniref:PE domain-containing protein n=1 Tax=Actinomadura rudentiformis TaxID=359158 RepID=A0A6H9YYN4_9ACTN|nr:PE domain-containing protein [Actinomadura rudentiformis]KAB2347847.1 PE domain-containing protein [Actinomadura rudentiformis]